MDFLGYLLRDCFPDPVTRIIVCIVGVLIVTVAKLLYLLHDTDQPVGSEYGKFRDSKNKKII